MLVKTNVPGYMKDSKSSLIINTNISELSEYNANKNKIKKDKILQDKILSLDHEIKRLNSIVNTLIKKIDEIEKE